MDFTEMMRGAVAPEDNRTDKELARDLRAVAGQLTEPRPPLEVGDIVVHRFPAFSTTKNAARPAIVREVLAEPIRPRDGSVPEPIDWHNAAVAATLDIIIGCFCDGRYHECFVDSREYQVVLFDLNE